GVTNAGIAGLLHGSIRLHTLKLSRCQSLTDTAVSVIAECVQGLQCLDLDFAAPSNIDMCALGGLSFGAWSPNAASMSDIGRRAITDKGIGALSKHFPELKQLGLSGTLCASEGLQGAMMKLMMEHMKTLAASVEVAEEAAAKAASEAGGSAQSGDAELEELKKLPYVPHVEGNPFPTRPATPETDMPQLYNLYNDKTYDALSKRTNSSLRYEQSVLAPALFIHARRNRVFRGSDWLVSDSVLTKWLKQFDTTKAKAVMQTHAKANAKVSTFRDRQGGKGKGAAGVGAGKGEGGRGSGKGGKAGANSEVMQWISKGAKMRWVDKAPLPFDHGVSLGDATPPQVEWMAAETGRCLKTGAWVRARRRRHVTRVFLVPEPGTNKRRLAMDFRWLNSHCVKSRCKMETLKKLRRLAKSNDWCISFDLQDGYHVVGIDPAFQEYMQFDVRRELFQCGALPFGWNASHLRQGHEDHSLLELGQMTAMKRLALHGLPAITSAGVDALKDMIDTGALGRLESLHIDGCFGLDLAGRSASWKRPVAAHMPS
ncbi:hypothetical protein CYMTET_8750, partial [Cymbomonas tetramitiformis]